jgi:hypothetical protein
LLGVLSLAEPAADENGRLACTHTRVDNGDQYHTWVNMMIADHGGA